MNTTTQTLHFLHYSSTNRLKTK